MNSIEIDNMNPVHNTVHANAITDKISVLHLIHTMAYGGVETVVINWLRELDRDKFDVHVICFENPGVTEGPFVEAAERNGLRISKIPWGRHKPLISSARCLAEYIRSNNIDILHAHNWYADFVAVIAARMAPVKSITTSYVWHDYDWKRNILQSIDKYAIRFFDKITAHCEITRQGTIDRGISPEDVSTLICGFETHRVEYSAEERSRLRQEKGVADNELVLLNIARFYPEKAHDYLLRVFRKILDLVPGTRLWIAGVGPLEKDIRNQCNMLGLDSKVEFLGFVQDLPALLPLADIQVHPAHVEGVPLAICEGMAASLPVVASKVGGLPEILDYGNNGVLIAPGNEGAFVQAVVELANDKSERERLGIISRHFIENDYSLKTAVSNLEKTYFEMHH